jgi:hypothetical protein
MACLDKSDGRIRWRHELPKDLHQGFSAAELAIGGGHVVVLTPKGLLRASVETGALSEIARPK